MDNEKDAIERTPKADTAVRQPTYLETKISAVFIDPNETTSEGKESSLAEINKHAEDVCKSLQPVFQKLVLDMMDLKRQIQLKRA